MKKTLTKLSRAFCLIALLLCCMSMGVQAQNLTVKGTVTDAENDETLIGVSVFVVGTGTGTVTDFDGTYSISAKKGDRLTFSYTGMKTQEFEVTSETLDVVMSDESKLLEEVIVIGYGTAKKKELTGAVARVDSKTLEQVVTSDVGTALQGQVAGVNVTASSGDPGAAANIQIRGITSLDGTNTPLYVVDGIPQDGDPRLAPNEIKSIDILKDAASASIYGTRGAAGVILITTKSGEAGKMKVALNQSYGINRIFEGTPLMNTADQVYFETTQSEFTDGAFNSQILQRPQWLENESDFRSIVQNDNAATQNYSINISGGTKDFSYSAVGGMYDQEGTLNNSSFRRYNGRITTLYKKDKFRIRGSVAMTTEFTNRTSSGTFLAAIRYKPYQPAVDPDTEIVEVISGPAETVANNLLQNLRDRVGNNRDRINGSLSANYQLTKSLSINTDIGTGITNSLSRGFRQQFTTVNLTTGIEETDPTRSFVSRATTRATNFAWNTGLNWNKDFGKHNVKALAAFSVDERKSEYYEAGRQGVANNEVSVINGGTINPYANSGTGNRQDYIINTLGTIGRLQYNYDNRYLFSASVRRDGSSKFAGENRYAVFPSFSAAWNIAEEGFWANMTDKVDNFKLRGSWGTTGNESFPAYRYSTIIQQEADYIFGTNIGLGAAQRDFANSTVRWETSVQANIGFDIGFWENKLTLTADYYDTRKKDMLFPVRLPSSAGVLSGTNSLLTLNVGDMTNKGIELAARYRIRTGKMRWNLGATYTRNRNEITRINGDTDIIYNASSTSIIGDGNSVVSTLAVGHEVASFFLFQTDGTIKNEQELEAYQLLRPDARLGDLRYVDTDDDGELTESDRVYSGSGLPDYEFGANLTWSWKGLDMNMQWYGSIGHEIINGSAAYAYNFTRHQDLVYQWTPVNPTSDIPLHRGDSKSHPNYAGTTDFFLEDGSFLRLRTITLGYSLPKSLLQRMKIGKFRLYVTGQNILTFTDYTGFDPEIGGNNVTLRGLDRGNYPVGAMYLFGAQVVF